MGIDFIDESYVGNELREAVIQLGEDVIFYDKDGNIVETCKMSLSNKASNGKLSATKVFEFAGEMAFSGGDMIETLRGKYFDRIVEPGKKYILASTSTLIPYINTLATVEVLECNKIISIGLVEEKHNSTTGNVEDVFTARYESIDAYYNANIKSPLEAQIGDIPKTVITFSIPSHFPVTTKDKISVKEFVSKKGDNNPVYGEQLYDVIAVDSTFVNTWDGENFYGIFKVDAIKRI